MRFFVSINVYFYLPHAARISNLFRASMYLQNFNCNTRLWLFTC